MPSPAIFAKPTLLKKGATTIAEVKSIGAISMQRDALDVTSMDTVGLYRAFIAGLIDGGVVPFGINFLPQNGTHDEVTGLLKDMDDGSTDSYSLTWPNTQGTMTFDAFMRQFQINAPVDNVLSADCELKIDGKPVFA